MLGHNTAQDCVYFEFAPVVMLVQTLVKTAGLDYVLVEDVVVVSAALASTQVKQDHTLLYPTELEEVLVEEVLSEATKVHQNPARSKFLPEPFLSNVP
jgi:predicted metallopeptidase